jgi:uncharacterized protein (TIGR02246 family)
MKQHPEADRLLERDAEWARLASEGLDVEAIVSYWTDDAVVLPPGMPQVRGKEALRKYVEESLRIPGFNITWSSDEVVFSPDGNLAYLFSRNAVTVPGLQGEAVTSKGRAVTIWRRESDGEWRCAVDIWNEAAAAD